MSDEAVYDKVQGTMDFGACLEVLLLGKKCRRMEWSTGDYIVISDEKLLIFKPEDKRLHPLTVSTGDMTAEDWVVVKKDGDLS